MSQLRMPWGQSRLGAFILTMGLCAGTTVSHAREAANSLIRSSPPQAIDQKTALAILRTASDEGAADAIRMLGSLSEGPVDPGGTSIRLYLAAQEHGDGGARSRLDVLRRQGVFVPFSAALVDSPSTTGQIVPMGKMGEELEPGYHCHFLRPGQMWCHSGVD